MRLVVALSCVLVPAAAIARQPALHDIPWYTSHDQVRQVTLRMCHQNATLQHASDDCENAERAEATVPFRGTARHPLNYLYSPAYWSQNPLSRSGELVACDHPSDPANAISLPFCEAARESIAQGATAR